MAKVIKKNKRLTKEELELLDKTELVNKVLQLEAHNFQLKQIIGKQFDPVQKDVKALDKKIDFSKYQKRHIFLKFYYLGWDYQGFATQEDTTNTIEHHIFYALTRSCLIESRDTSNYHRCGRTDKGVSAFSQVISLDVRSRLVPEKQDNFSDEMPYCKILNRLLPRNIRFVSWSPASDDMSARFNCNLRCYKYFFPRGNLDIEAMNTAASYVVGSHDFRNLCKMDVGNGVVNFIRNIDDAKISCPSIQESSYDMCELTIKSKAFLWHQIRCIMGILLLVGQKKENPEIVKELLDVENCPRKPQYNLAHYIPLNLFYCEFDNMNWYIDKEEMKKVFKDLQEEWTTATVKSAMIKKMLSDLESHFEKESEDLNFQSDCLLQGVESNTYKLLKDRVTCASLDERISHYSKKRRIVITEENKT